MGTEVDMGLIVNGYELKGTRFLFAVIVNWYER